MTIGWWDKRALWQWADHRRIDRDPRWRAGEYLLLEAIDHENHSHFELPDLKSAAESEAVLRRMLQPAVDFFDVFLRGAPNTIPRVRWQLANSGDPSLGTVLAGRRLALVKTSCTCMLMERSSEALTLHPERSSPCRGGTIRTTSCRRRSMTPSPTCRSTPTRVARMRRNDVLAFVGEELEEHLDLVGPVSLSCHVSSESPEFDVFIRLLDVSADGSAHLIARGRRTVVRSRPSPT